MSEDIIKRLEELERKTTLLAVGYTCNCVRHARCEYEGSWYCEFHGSCFGEWADYRYNITYKDDLDE